MPLPCEKNRLLIVDDEVSIVRLFKIILSSALPDITIDTAHNGQEAVELFEKLRPGTLLMDLHMPVMDGRKAFETIQALCENNDWAMPSIIFCTGYAPPNWVHNVIRTHKKHQLLTKPVTSPVLIEAVKSRM